MRSLQMMALGQLLFAGGLMFFLRGFLLTKRELLKYSTGNEFCLECHAEATAAPTAVFLFVIDALRLDFMRQVDFADDDSIRELPYNRLRTISRLLRENRSHSRIFGFRADPPTVTAQRLQALTTGGLPTFLDIRRNMNAARILEDNWISQLRAKEGRRLVYMGDDTWQSLFPDAFDVFVPFPSFNTRDIFGVDDGIEEHLFVQLEQRWDLFIAHFLGVDHVGHTYSAFHPAMSERLDRMDNLLARVIDRLPPGAVLLLFGDHGMTAEGEHGGASPEETDSGLFVYRRPRAKDLETTEGRCPGHDSAHTNSSLSFINQIDLVPTLSVALGLPLPFSSVGALAPELLEVMAPRSKEGFADALFVNAMQVARYLVMYSCGHDLVPPDPHEDSKAGRIEDITVASRGINEIMGACFSAHGLQSTFPVGRMDSLMEGLLVTLDSHRLHLLHPQHKWIDAHPFDEGYLTFLREAQALCRQQWTRFDVSSMTSGLLLLALVFGIGSAVVWQSIDSGAGHAVLALYVIPVFCSSVWHTVSMLSNSFITEEPWLLMFSLQSISVGLAAAVMIYRRLSVSEGLLLLLALLAAPRAMWALRDMPHESSLPSSASATDLISAVATPVIMSFAYRQVLSVIDISFYQRLLSGLFLFEMVGLVGAWLGPVCPGWDERLSELSPRMVLIISAMALFLCGVVRQRSHGIMVVFMHLLSSIALLLGPRHGILAVLLVWIFYVNAYAVRVVVSSSPDSLSSVVVASSLHCALIGRFAFMCSGQRLGFAGMHLSVGFIGATKFYPYYAGIMLAIHVFGFDALAALAAIIVSTVLWGTVHGNEGPGKTRLTTYTLITYRMGMGCMAALCGVLHRRHLMVWAIFAPKVIFELIFTVAMLILYSCIYITAI